MTTCTWQKCNAEAKHPQVSSDKETWANLCDAHSAELESAIGGGDPKTMLSAWTQAGGGAKVMAARITKKLVDDGGLEKIQRLVDKIKGVPPA